MTWTTEPASESQRPLKRTEYDQLVASGAFTDEHVELIRGRILRTGPQGDRHAWCIQRLTRLFRSLPAEADLRVQSPFAASDDSEPEPDLAVVAARDDDYAHPSAASLLIEVSDDSRRRDLGLKADLYASADVREYWVVDLKARCVVVHRYADGSRATQITTVRPGGSVSPVAFPDLVLPLDAFMPVTA